MELGSISRYSLMTEKKEKKTHKVLMINIFSPDASIFHRLGLLFTAKGRLTSFTIIYVFHFKKGKSVGVPIFA